LVGASPETSFPCASSLDNLAGSRKPSEALVGVTSQPPSSSRTLMLPEEPGVSPRSNSERPNRQMASRIADSATLLILDASAFAALSHALAARPSRDTQGK